VVSSSVEVTLLSPERLALGVQVECRIELEYESEAQANIVANSISLDNDKYAYAEVHGRRLVISSSAASAPSMLHTLEDLMACSVTRLSKRLPHQSMKMRLPD
jgi:hypothetical protein